MKMTTQMLALIAVTLLLAGCSLSAASRCDDSGDRLTLPVLM